MLWVLNSPRLFSLYVLCNFNCPFLILSMSVHFVPIFLTTSLLLTYAINGIWTYKEVAIGAYYEMMEDRKTWRAYDCSDWRSILLVVCFTMHQFWERICQSGTPSLLIVCEGKDGMAPWGCFALNTPTCGVSGDIINYENCDHDRKCTNMFFLFVYKGFFIKNLKLHLITWLNIPSLTQNP